MSSSTTSAATTWAMSTSSARRTPTRGSSRSTCSARSRRGRVRDADGRRGRDPDRPVLRAHDPAREQDQGLRARGRQGAATSARRSRRSSPRRASSRATPPSWSRSSTSRCRRSSTRRARSTRTRPILHEEAGLEPRPGAACTSGATRRRVRGGRSRRHGSSGSTSTASTRRRSSATAASSSTSAAPASGRSLLQPPDPGLRRDHGWGRRCGSASTSCASSPRTSAAASGTRSACIRSSSPAVCSRASSDAPSSGRNGARIQQVECRTGTSAAFLDVEVPVKEDGTLLGFSVQGDRRLRRLPALRAARRASSGRRSRRGCYRWRNIRVDFTQVCTNKSPSRRTAATPACSTSGSSSGSWTSSRHELDLDPVEVRKKNYIRAEEMPYTTPNGCVYDSGDYARCLDIALELVGHEQARGAQRRRREPAASCSASGSARHSTRGRTTSGSR